MNSSLKIAIIGRGIAGLSAAYRLWEAGFRPTLFGEREGASVASRCAQGVLCNKGLFFADSPLFRAKLESLAHMKALLPELEEKSGMKIPHFFSGVEEPYFSAEDFQSTVSRVYRQRFWGCHGTQNRGGHLFYPRDGWFDVPALLDALEAILRKDGILFEERNVQDLGELDSFDRIIIAAGSGFREIFPQLGLAPLKNFAIAGQTLRFQLPSPAIPKIQVKATLSLARYERTAVLGSTSLKEGMPLEEDRAELIKKAKTYFDMKDLDEKNSESRFGVRLRFSDRMPLVGFAPAPHSRIYFLSGFYKNGVHLADICAQDLVRDFLGEPRRYPEFSYARFQKAK